MALGSLLSATAPIAGDLRQPGPDIGEHDDDERRQIEQHDQPGIEQPVGEPRAAHDVADRRAEAHRQQKGGDDARQRDGEIGEQRAGARLLAIVVEDGERSRQAARIGEPRRRSARSSEQRRERGETDQCAAPSPPL